MAETLNCPYCSRPLTHYGAGHSEYEWQCDPCGAAVQPDEAAGVARTRRWDRQAARGVHEDFPIARLREPGKEQP